MFSVFRSQPKVHILIVEDCGEELSRLGRSFNFSLGRGKSHRIETKLRGRDSRRIEERNVGQERLKEPWTSGSACERAFRVVGTRNTFM